MLDFAPCLDDVFFRISDVVQSYLYRILVVFEVDNCLCSPCHGLLLGRYIAENRTWISVAVSDSHSRFEIVFGTGTRIDFPAACRNTAVTATFYIRRKVLDILLI